jgi:flavin reductase (DIM6/NTAB) family NADH-FMN oxidoreductase RutF
VKIDVEYLQFMWPMRHFFITCGDIKQRANIIAISFCMPVSKQPPLIACAIGKKTYSYQLIKKNKEFIVNVPLSKLKAQIYYCGFHSGSSVDKFLQTGLTARPARSLKAPIIAECVAHMECKLAQVIETGDKNLFIGEVIEAYAEEDVVKTEKRIAYAQGDFPQKVYATRFKPK